MSAIASQPSGNPPQSYRLDDTTIKITRHPGRATAPSLRVSVSGTGIGTLAESGRTHEFRYPGPELLALLNELYAMRFFALPNDYTRHDSVHLKDDGTIVTSMLRMVDAPSTTVCFSAAAFKKCVTYGNQAPSDLEGFAKRLFAQAGKLTSAEPK